MDLDLFTATQGRDEALQTLEAFRADVIHALRAEALAIWDDTGRPVCVNDLRDALRALGYTGDPRVLGAVFMKSAGWIPWGYTTVKGSKAHARTIRTFARRQG